VKWCPSVPHCGRAIGIRGDSHIEVDCHCGKSFCFACCESPHTPSTCEMNHEWCRRIVEGTETSSWLQAHTKPCPKCCRPVEKVGGCNLVVCPCGQAFCWLCGKSTGRAHDWNNIQGHSCGAFREEAESKATESQRSLNRWLHYLTRYDGHLKSMRLEERAREDLDAKVEAMMSQSSSLTNFSWLFQSGRQLFRARRVLAHSYVFAFFVFGPSFKDEFTPQSASSIQALFESGFSRSKDRSITP